MQKALEMASSSNKTDPEASPCTPRRTQRNTRLSLKAIESAYLTKFKKSGFVQGNISEESTEESEDSDNELCENVNTPTILHKNDKVEGDKIFTIRKQKRNGLFKKVAEVVNQEPKTPHSLRNKIRKKIASNVLDSESENDSSDSGSECDSSKSETLSANDKKLKPKTSKSPSKTNRALRNKSNESISKDAGNESNHEFSDSGSEYEISDESSDSSEKSSSSSDNEDSDGGEKYVKPKPTAIIQARKSTRTKQLNKKYVINTEEYFSNHSTKKILTSNHTLDKLETPRLPQDQLHKMLKTMKLSKEHEKCMKEVSSTNNSNFNKWLYLLHENFNILVYGLGSKRNILTQFQSECLQNLPVIVVNGFFPTLTIKDILDGIICDLLEMKESPANIYEACDIIEEEFSYIPNSHLYLIVHNIDGQMLRNKRSQDVLARLANVRNFHLIASIDHINAPLIWDHNKLSKFNYTWWDVTSFLPYIEETSFDSCMMVQGGATLALSSLRNVFLSLTVNSKGIYLMIVKYQLDNGKNQYYQGLAFRDLYASCRESFLVSSDIALRAQLNEFVDHKMVKYKRSVDGTEFIQIPIANDLLKQFLEEQSQ